MPVVRKYNTKEVNSSGLLEVASNDLFFFFPRLLFFFFCCYRLARFLSGNKLFSLCIDRSSEGLKYILHKHAEHTQPLITELSVVNKTKDITHCQWGN